MNSFLIGCDPEIFVGNSTGPRSIVGLIGGTKECPLPIEPLGPGFAVQEDNVALEFNIPASNSKELFVANVSSAMEFLEKVVGDMHQLHFVKDSAISFPESELQTSAAQRFGCDPDFNAWSGRANPRPRAEDKNLRSCGGHVHIGIRDTKYEICEPRTVIKWMDLLCSVPAVLMDKGELRKELYGKAGAYRIKPYGLEYRTMSNFWVFDKQKQGWVYDNTERALDAVFNKDSFAGDEALIQTAINSNDKQIADYLIGKYNLTLV